MHCENLVVRSFSVNEYLFQFFIGGILITRVKCTPFMNQLYRSRVLEETRDADSRIREVTKLVRPEIKSRLNHFFGLFEALSYYTWSGRRDGEKGKFFWTKVRCDDGIMHVKVEEIVIHIGEFAFKAEALVEYQTGKTLHELLPFL